MMGCKTATRVTTQRSARTASWESTECSVTARLPPVGVAVYKGGNGSLLDGRMHQLVRHEGEVRERTVEITFLEPSPQPHVFTVG